MSKSSVMIIIKAALIYSLAYLIVGAIAYQFLTKQFYIGDNPIFTMFLRSESNQVQWAHVMQWQFPMLLLRSILIACVLLPFVQTLKSFSFIKRVGIVFALIFVLTHLAAAAPSPGNIEGIVYMRPELMSTDIFLAIQPEMILHSLIFALGFAYILKTNDKTEDTKDS